MELQMLQTLDQPDPETRETKETLKLRVYKLMQLVNLKNQEINRLRKAGLSLCNKYDSLLLTHVTLCDAVNKKYGRLPIDLP